MVVLRVILARQGRVLPAMVVRRAVTVLLVVVLLSAIVLRAGVSTGRLILVLRISGMGVDTILITSTIIILTGLMYMVRPGIRLAFSSVLLRQAQPSLH